MKKLSEFYIGENGKLNIIDNNKVYNCLAVVMKLNKNGFCELYFKGKEVQNELK